MRVDNGPPPRLWTAALALRALVVDESASAEVAHAPAEQLDAFGRNLTPSRKYEDFRMLFATANLRSVVRCHSSFIDDHSSLASSTLRLGDLA
jgi:hypothetical protein